MAIKKSQPGAVKGPSGKGPAVKGPASYFPSIESKYGHPVDYWFSLIDKLSGMKHMEIVAWLKSEHAMGHGHANALVAYHLSKKG